LIYIGKNQYLDPYKAKKSTLALRFPIEYVAIQQSSKEPPTND